MEKTKSAFIYCLKHPETLEIRYIGKSTNPKKRYCQHIKNSKGYKFPLYQWIDKLKSNGLLPIIEVLKETSLDKWEQVETETIKEYKENGFRLLNVSEGGNQPFCSKETRAENGRKNAISLHSDPVRKRFWYLKKQLAADFKTLGDTPKVLMMKEKLASRGIYFK